MINVFGRFVFFTLLLFITSNNSMSIHQNDNSTKSLPLLLLISLDGFRWDYPDIYHLPNFNLILKRGVRVEHIDNSFATVTFPSHFTIITGLYEETHGIVANHIYDPELNDVGTITTMNDSKWWSQNSYSEPIWVSNQLANDSSYRRSGVIAWPGSNTLINGHRPFKYQDYDQKRSFSSSIDQIFQWFRASMEDRINFGVIYHFEPDKTGHVFGPISPEMNATLKQCDEDIGRLLTIIDGDKIFKENLNVIITSDHGMHDIDKRNKIILENYIDKSLFSAYGARSFANIFVKNKEDIDRIYRNLSTLSNYEIYKKSDIPYEYHYQKNVRIGDILIIGKVGYEIVLPGSDSYKDYKGDHGYDNRAESMHPIFYAFGPAFRRNLLAKPFRNVDIYPLISYILRLNQRSTNGSFDRVKHILVDIPSRTVSDYLVLICLIMIIVIAIIFAVCACRHSHKLVYVPPINESVQYQLLNNDEDSTNNLVASGSDEEEAIM